MFYFSELITNQIQNGYSIKQIHILNYCNNRLIYEFLHKFNLNLPK